MSDATQAVHAHEAPGTGPGSGTLRVFKRLRRNRMNLVRHGFGTMPLVDVYELEQFDVVSSADEISDAQQVQFYVYHTTDASARVRGPDGGTTRITVDDSESRDLRIPFDQALKLARVKYNDRSTLGDVVVEFWSAFFTDPSDTFDETSYGNSPWLDRAVGDRRTVAELKRGGGWDDLFLQFRPRKTINWPPVGWYYPYAQPVASPPYLEKAVDPRLSITREATTVPYLEKAIDPRLIATRETATVPSDSIDPQRLAAMRPRLGLPPGVEVVQVGLNAVGLQLRDDGPEEVNVMVLLRP
jgi:hypothetical protein